MPEAADPAARLQAWQRRVDLRLAGLLPDQTLQPVALHAAMRHAVLLGGKRIRPLLVYATGTLFGASEASLDAPAAAVEMIHAYSLVHDDLPAMDDDTLRRGQPTVHVAFDEATAILAGDALQALAFETLATQHVDAALAVAQLRELAIAAGARGMCGGQALDIAATGGAATGGAATGGDATGSACDADNRNAGARLAALETMHAAKTGALIRAAVRMGALRGHADQAQRSALDSFADALGLAFQIRDDLLDVEGDSAALGKTAGKDAAQDKATFPSVIGIDASRARLVQLATAMDAALRGFGDEAATLKALGRMAIDRTS